MFDLMNCPAPTEFIKNPIKKRVSEEKQNLV